MHGEIRTGLEPAIETEGTVQRGVVRRRIRRWCEGRVEMLEEAAGMDLQGGSG